MPVGTHASDKVSYDWFAYLRKRVPFVACLIRGHKYPALEPPTLCTDRYGRTENPRWNYVSTSPRSIRVSLPGR